VFSCGLAATVSAMHPPAPVVGTSSATRRGDATR
jgi:hypothetical protein